MRRLWWGVLTALLLGSLIGVPAGQAFPFASALFLSGSAGEGPRTPHVALKTTPRSGPGAWYRDLSPPPGWREVPLYRAVPLPSNLTAMNGGSTIQGTVYEPDGTTPLDGAFVELYDDQNDPVASDTAGGGGAYQIPNVAAGTYTLIAYPPTTTLAASVPLSVTVDGTNPVTRDLTVTTINVQGLVRGPAGEVITTTGVLIYNADQSVLRTAGVDKGDASFRVGGLVTGTYTIEALPGDAPYARSYTQTFTITDVTVPVDVGTLSLTIPEVTGTVRYPTTNGLAPGAAVWVHNADWTVSEVALANDEGVFRIDRLPAGAYILEAFPPTGAPYAGSEPQTVLLTPGTTLNAGDLTLRYAQVQGQLQDSGGSPVRGGYVMVFQQGSNLSQGVTTNADGSFYIGGLPAGLYTLEAFPPAGSTDTPSLRRTVEVYADGSTNDIGVVRLTFPQIQGTVMDPEGQMVAGAFVEAVRSDGTFRRGGVTDASGQYRVGGLPDGTYTLTAYPPTGSGWATSVPQTVTVNDGIPLVRHFQLTRVRVQGTVTDPQGQPVRGAGVELRTTDGSTRWSGGTDQNGLYRLGGGIPDGSYQLEVFAPWGSGGMVAPGPVPVTLTGSSPITVDVQFLAAPKHVVGTVRREDGSPLPNVRVNAVAQGETAWVATTTAGDGTYRLDLRPGRWEVSLAAPEGTVADWLYGYPPHLLDFTPLTDTTEVTVTLPFTVTTATAHVVGQVRRADGRLPTPGSLYVEVRNSAGFGNGVVVNGDGSFDVPLVAGTYQVHLYSSDPEWGSPPLPHITLKTGKVRNLGTLTLIRRTVHIRGRVTRLDTGEGIGGIPVHAWARNGRSWWSTTTTPDGQYDLAVTPGRWNVGPAVQGTAFTAQVPSRRLAGLQAGQVITGVDFVLVETDARLEGRLVDEEGKPFTRIHGWAYIREGASEDPTLGVPVRRGRFSLSVPSGTPYWAGVWLPPGMPYTVEGEQQVTLNPGEERTITITVRPLRTLIVGRFQQPANLQVSGEGGRVRGIVYATSGQNGTWQSTRIRHDGSYVLPVAAGCWNVGYQLEGDDYVSNPYPDTRVCLEERQVYQLDWTLVPAETSIEGIVYDPMSSPLSGAWAWAEGTTDRLHTGAASGDDGRFSIPVPEGTYVTGASLPADYGYIQPAFQTVTATAGASAFVTLTFRQADATIVGRLSLNGVSGQPAFYNASVWGWSDEGTYAVTAARYDGTFSLPVTRGSTWRLGAVYEYHDPGAAGSGRLVYRTTQDYVVRVGETDVVTQDMELFLETESLPDPVTVVIEPDEMAVVTLEDGSQVIVPPGALSTEGSVTLMITPMAAGLAETMNSHPVGFAYALFAFDEQGRQITGPFRRNVLLRFRYEERWLGKRFSTRRLRPAYFSTTNNAWTYPERYAVDTYRRIVTLSIDHFTIFALVATDLQEPPRIWDVYLPVVARE